MANGGAQGRARFRAAIQTRLLAPIIVTVMVMVALTFLGYWQLSRQAMHDARGAAQGLARQAAREYEQSVIRAGQLLASFSHLPQVTGGDEAECQRFLSAIVRELPRYANVGVVAPDGRLLCSALGTAPGATATPRRWFHQALSTGRLSAGEFQEGKLTHRPTVNVALPVRGADGAIERVLFAAVVLDPVRRLLSEVLPAGASLLLVDVNGRVLARSPDGAGWTGRDVSAAPLVRTAAASSEGAGTFEGLDGVPRVFGWQSLRGVAAGAGTVLVGLSEVELVGQSRAVMARTLVALAAVGVLLIALTWFVSGHTVVRRIRALVAYSRTLQSGALEATSGIGGTDELRELANAMEDLARASRDALQARDDFLSAATHELRSPITVAVLHAERLKRDTASDPAVARRAQAVQNNVSRLGRLVDSLLDFSRLRAGRFGVERQPADLVEVVRGTVERYQDVAAAAGTEVRCRAPDRLYGDWDVARLDIAFGNLIGNAIKYGRGKPVDVTMGAEGGAVWVSVEDRGVGIPEDQLSRVFGRFERASTAGARQGFGFGLYIARQIVEAHGGALTVESEVDRGSTFRVRLPLGEDRA